MRRGFCVGARARLQGLECSMFSKGPFFPHSRDISIYQGLKVPMYVISGQSVYIYIYVYIYLGTWTLKP